MKTITFTDSLLRELTRAWSEEFEPHDVNIIFSVLWNTTAKHEAKNCKHCGLLTTTKTVHVECHRLQVGNV